MKKDIIQRIEQLVEMSGTTNTYETINEELIVINQEIEKQKEIVRDLKKTMADNKYLKANERIIDENIKIGIENRLNVSCIDLKELKIQIISVSEEEELIHASIVSLEQELSQLKRFSESLELKMKTIGKKDQNIFSFYDSLMKQTNDEIIEYEERLLNLKNDYNKIAIKLEQLGTLRANLEAKINKEELSLSDVCESLANPNSYIDYRTKRQDEVLIDKYIMELENLEHKRLEILTDPAYIGQEAKELYFNDDKTSSLNKVRELVTIITSKPYMDTLYSDLEELLEEAVSQRDEFANIIDNKAYIGEDISVVNLRVEYLENLKEKKLAELELLKQEIVNIDINLVKDFMQKINTIKDVRKTLKEDIDSYNKVIQENAEQKTPKKKANLKSALKNKIDELLNVEKILNSFEDDLEKAVIKSKNLEEQDLMILENEISLFEQEILELKKLTIMNSYSKDILAVEKDKDELKKLSDNVQAITNRKKYVQTATELFDEIELSYGTDEISEETSVVESKKFIDLDDYRIETSTTEEPVLESEPVTEEVEENVISKPVLFNDNFEDIFSSISLDELEVNDFPPRKAVEDPTSEKRMKVIRVEPLEEIRDSSTELLAEDDVVISEIEDNEYISFNDLLNGDTNDN